MGHDAAPTPSPTLRNRKEAAASDKLIEKAADADPDLSAAGVVHKSTGGDAAAHTGFVRESPYANPLWLFPLFFGSKFFAHRILGLLYLIQYALAWRLYVSDYPAFSRSPLLWTLPVSGVLQAVTATYYFYFLPKIKADPGYYSDKSVLSYAFVKENIFFSALLAFQWLYYADAFYGPFRTNPALSLVEHAFVFMPYAARGLVPKTRFRDSLESDRNKSEGNAQFYYWGTQVTKAFYLWAKWYIGFFLNYVRYLGAVSDAQRVEMYCLLLFSCFATTIGVFLHTLKFKGYLGPRTSFVVYMLSYMATFYSIARLGDLFAAHLPLVAITAVAMALNRFGHLAFGERASPLVGHAFQAATMALLYCVRTGAVTGVAL